VCVAVALESVAINPIASLVVSNTMTGLRYGTKITINLHSLYTDMVVLVLEHIPSSLNNTKITTDVRNLSEQGQIAHPFTERPTRLRYRGHVRFAVTRSGGRRCVIAMQVLGAQVHITALGLDVHMARPVTILE
jgi:hypothetical protein